MSHFILKYLTKFVIWFTSRHRVVGLRDWAATVFCTGLLAVAVGAMGVILILQKSVDGHTPYFLFYALAIVTISIASVPVMFAIKLRRNGITDADYSVASGIDYEQALSGARAGFDFVGIGASKLRGRETELRQAVRVAEKQGKKVRLLLVDPETSSFVFERLEKMDSTSGYSETVGGSLLFLRKLALEKPDCVEIRLYHPKDLSDVKPLRMFFHDEICGSFEN